MLGFVVYFVSFIFLGQSFGSNCTCGRSWFLSIFLFSLIIIVLFDRNTLTCLSKSLISGSVHQVLTTGFRSVFTFSGLKHMQ